MATSWRGVVVEQAELISTRIRQLASSGLRFLDNEFGIDLGLKPELYPSWVILSTALFGIIAVVALSCVAACGGVGRRKRGAAVSESSISVTDNAKAPLTKSVKSEEPKKKTKKKSADKQKTQPNGRTVPEQREEIKPAKETPKEPPPPPPPQPPADIKADKAKKNKKKLKPEVKQNQGISSTDGKEPDEGAWETKISNREKRQQRRKEKGPGDNSGSPGGGNHVTQQLEQPLATAPVSTKKNKESLNSKAGKADVVNTPASNNWNAVSSVNSGGWTEMSVKLPSKVSASDSQKWSVGMKTSGHRNSEPLAWGQDSEGGSWTGMDGRIKTDLNPLSFSMLGLNPSAGGPVNHATADRGKWDNIATVDEWSGFNGLGAVDPSSDWNAPAELWGNYEEPKAEAPAPKDAPISQTSRLQESSDDKEKGDPSGSGKSKRKKKKKKKPEDENVAIEGLTAPTESVAIKPRPHVPVEEPVKQNAAQLSNQKKSDQNWEPAKQVQKKKARRET